MASSTISKGVIFAQCGGNNTHSHHHRHVTFLTLTLIWCFMGALAQVAHLQQSNQQSLVPFKLQLRTSSTSTTTSTTDRPKSTATTSRKPRPIADDRTRAANAEQIEYEQLKSALQARRVARNVRRKIDQMSNRVDQIQSLIAQDHDQNTRSSQNESMARESRSSDAGLWASAHLDENDNGDHLSPPPDSYQQVGGGDAGDSSERQSASNSTALRWSSPVISSVIPGRTHESTADQRAEATSSASNDPSAHLDAPQSQPSQADVGSASSADLESTSADKGGHNQDEQAASGAELSQNQTHHNDQSQSSMLGPEWASSQNYNYFSELNAKNHGGGVSSGDTPTAGSKFQNMTILNSDTDLANSYSVAGPTLVISNITGGTLVGTTPRPTFAEHQAQDQQQTTRRKSPSVHTYKAGNYGKSSREQLHAASTTSQPAYNTMGGSSSRSSAEPHKWTPAQLQQQQHYQHATGASGNNQRQLSSLASEQVVRWPALATPAPPSGYTTDLAAQSNQVGLPASMSNLPAANRYSSVMMSPGALTARQQQQEHHETGDNLAAHRYSLALGPERPTSGGGGQESNNQEHDTRHSMDAQRQLTNSIDTTIYERRHDQQPPPQEASTIVVQPQPLSDYYSSRLDTAASNSAPDTPSLLNNSIVDRSDQVGATVQHDHGLKHRSAGNSIMSLEEQMTGADNSIVSPAPLSSGGVGNGATGHTPSSIDTGALQQQSPLDSYSGQVASSGDMTGGYSAPTQPSRGQQLDPRAYYATFPQQHQQISPQESYNLNNGQQILGGSSYASITQDLQDSSLSLAQQQQLMNQLDQLSDQQQQQQQQAARQYSQQQQQHHQQSSYSPLSPSYYTTQSGSSLQEALHAAGGNQRDQQTLARQQRADGSSSTSPTAADYGAYLQAYQQQQRALAAQLASQQQGMLARAYHESSTSQQQHQQQVAPVDSTGGSAEQNSLAAAIQGNMLKRYSPETALANYLTARSSSMLHGGGSGGLSSSTSDQPQYYYYQQQQQQQQPPSSGGNGATQYYSTSTPGGASNAYLGAYHRAAQLASLGANYQRMLAEAASQQASSTTSSNSIPAGGSASQSGMYATSAMNQPVFYEAPASLVSQQRGVSSGPDSGAGTGAEVSTSGSSNGSSASRRNYFGGLFKPNAASRYYYGPTLLSPISLASPAGLHAIYAAAPSAATSAADTAASGTSQTTLGQYYALNPYMAAAAATHLMGQHQQQPYTQHYRPAASAAYASYQDPTGVAAAAAAQQYQQALVAAAAAAAAGGGFQPHYIGSSAGMMSGLGGGGGGSGNPNGAPAPDTDMAESSLDGSSTSTSSLDGSGMGDSESGSSSSSSSSGTSKSSGGGMKQWLTVASLLAGILPMGLVMASMLPMLTVAGRKKRELELFGARNLSDILTSSWQGGSGMLKALMQAPRYEFDGTARSANESSRALGDIVARASDHTSSQAKSARLLGSGAPGGFKGRRLGFGLGLGGVSASTSKPSMSSLNYSTVGPHAAHVLAAPSVGSQQQQFGTSTTPQAGGDLVPTTTSPGPLKSTMKKVLSKVNTLIVTAQKRKHRSSHSLDSSSRWFQVPGFLAASGVGNVHGSGQSWLGIKSLFDATEMKRYLADVVRARILAAAAAVATPTAIQQEPGQAQAAANLVASSRETPTETPRIETSAANETRASESQKSQRVNVGAQDSNQQRPLAEAGARNQTSDQTAHLLAQIHVEPPPPPPPPREQQQHLPNKVTYLQQPNMPVVELLTRQQHRPKPVVAIDEIVAPDLKGLKEAERPRKDVEAQLLMPCLYKIVCDLAGKLKRASMKNQNEIGNGEQEAVLTEQIVDQLINHIELADRETLVFGHWIRNERSNKDSRQQLISGGVMRDECSRLFTCPDARQFKKVFAQLRWPTRR